LRLWAKRRAKRTAPARSEPYLDLIEPEALVGSERKLQIGVGLEPLLVLFVGVEVVEDDVKFAVREKPW